MYIETVSGLKMINRSIYKSFHLQRMIVLDDKKKGLIWLLKLTDINKDKNIKKSTHRVYALNSISNFLHLSATTEETKRIGSYTSDSFPKLINLERRKQQADGCKSISPDNKGTQRKETARVPLRAL